MAMDRAAFVASLRAERRAFGEFCQLLEAEYASLQRSDVEELLKITQLKSDKVDRLAELATVRTRYLDSVGLIQLGAVGCPGQQCGASVHRQRGDSGAAGGGRIG
jgi:hypothetical protein